MAQTDAGTVTVLRCPVCSEPLDQRPLWTSRTCETPQHQECAQYIGGCSRFACPEAATPRRRVAEVLRLITSDEVIEHFGRCASFLFLCIPFFMVFWLPLLLAVVELARLGAAAPKKLVD